MNKNDNIHSYLHKNNFHATINGHYWWFSDKVTHRSIE